MPSVSEHEDQVNVGWFHQANQFEIVNFGLHHHMVYLISDQNSCFSINLQYIMTLTGIKTGAASIPQA